MVQIRRGSRAPRSGFRGTPSGVGKLTEQEMIARVESSSPRLNATRSDQALRELAQPELAATFPLVMQAAPAASPVIGPVMQDRYRDALLSGQVNNPNLNRMLGMRDQLRSQYASLPQGSPQRQAVAMKGKALNMAIDQEVSRSATNMARGSGASQRALIPVEDYYVPVTQQGTAPALVVQKPGGGSVEAAQTLDDVLSDVALQQSRIAPGTVESIYTGSKNYDPMQTGLNDEYIQALRQKAGLSTEAERRAILAQADAETDWRKKQELIRQIKYRADAGQRFNMQSTSEADALRNFDLGNRDNAIDTTASLSQRDITRPDFYTEDTQQPLGMRNAPPNYMMVREQYALAPVRTAPGEGQYLALSQTPTGAPLPVVPKGGEALTPGVVLNASQLGGSVGGGLPSAGLQYMTRVNPQTGLNVVDSIMQSPGMSGPRVMIGDRNQYLTPTERVGLGPVDLTTPGSLAFNKPLEPWAIPSMGTSGAGQYSNPRYSFENGVLMAQMPNDPMDIRPVNPITGKVDHGLVATMNQRAAAGDEYGRALGVVRDQYDFSAEPIRDELGYIIQPNNPDVMRNNPAGVGDPRLVMQGEAAAADALDRYITADRELRGTNVDVTPYQMVAKRLKIQGGNLQPESMSARSLTDSVSGGMVADAMRSAGAGRDYALLERIEPEVNPNETLAAMAQQAKLAVLNHQRATVGLPPLDPNESADAAAIGAVIDAQHLSRVRRQAEPLRQRAYQRQQEINRSRQTQWENELGMMSPQMRRIESLQNGLNLDQQSAASLNNYLVGRQVLRPANAPRDIVPADDYIMGLRQAMTQGGVRF